MHRIVIFASGSGTNAQNIIEQLHNKEAIVQRIYCNNPKAGIVQRAEQLNIPICFISRDNWNVKNNSDWQIQIRTDNPDLLVLAGFLWKIPEYLIEEYPNKIINLHPSLLPKYGGKGMYGMNVHNAVMENKELTTGITIHYVNAEYDKGGIIFQTEIYVAPSQSAEALANRIHQLEYQHFPETILQVLKS